MCFFCIIFLCVFANSRTFASSKRKKQDKDIL